MTELTQQVLLDPDPPRALKAPPGAGWLGVDPSTLRVAAAVISPDGSRRVATRSFIRATGSRRLAFIYRDTFEFVRELPPVGFGFVEMPGGKHVPPELSWAVGVIQAAVYAALHRPDCPPTVELIPPATWKKLACGAGNLYKPKRERGGPPPAFADYPVAVWARENGYTGSSWDECDALGIAVAARRTVRFE